MAGLSSDQVDRLVIDVYAHGGLDPARRRAVGPYRSVLVVLIYLRHNLSQALVAELFGCSQPTVSRLIGRLAPTITTVLGDNADRVAAQQLRSTVRVDGFLAPTGDRREGTYTGGMYSGKRHRCGFNIQVVGSATAGWSWSVTHSQEPRTTRKPGTLRAWPRSSAGRLHADGGPGGFADTAYTGTGLLVPAANPTARTSPNPPATATAPSHWASVERVIAHLKNWKLLATGYRGLLDRFPIFLVVITKLEIYRTS